MCIRKRLLLSLVVGALCLNSGRLRCGPQAAAGELSESPPAQNLILITLSTLRADHLGSFGYERDTTPNFDAFAAQTVLFRNAFAVSSWMMPAHGSIFTSLYPSIHGATHIDKALRDEPRTLAEILGESGYYCIGFCCGPRLDQEYGFARGFDLYDDYTVSVMLDSMVFGDGQTTDINRCRTNNLINDAAIRWLQNNTHKPFFMFVHYYDNHWDYLPPAPYNKLYDPDYQGPIDGTQIAREPLYSNPPDKPDIQHIVALYDGEVRQTDKDLGEMLEFLKERGLYENSIIIVMGDHGEQFYEHGHTSHHGLFEELTHIPLDQSPRSFRGIDTYSTGCFHPGCGRKRQSGRLSCEPGGHIADDFGLSGNTDT
ncbi:MAG: sulfatase [Planctomycetota bacterium]